MEPPAPVPDTPCAKHPSRPLAGTCSRCGKFICIDCAPELATHPEEPCEECKARQPPQKRTELTGILGGVAIAFALVYGALAFYFGASWGLGVGVVLCAGLGVALIRSKSAGIGLLLVGVEGACLSHLFELSGAQLLFLLGLVPIFTGIYVRMTWRDTLASAGVPRTPLG
jgi:hypothetical protein